MSWERIQNTINNFPVMWRSTDREGIITDCNQVYLDELGYSKGEVVGKSIFDFVSSESLANMRKSFEIWKTQGIIKNMEIVMKRKDGSTFPALLSSSAIYADSEIICSNTVIMNVSEIKDALRHIEWDRIRRLHAIGELSARIAHDIRNPLSIIKNGVELVKRKMVEGQDEYLESNFKRVERGIMRIAHQIDNVLDYVRPMPLTLETIDVAVLVNSSIDKVDIPKSVKMNVSIPHFSIECDRYKMEIVLINLITNAIQAMENKGQIDILAFEENDLVTIKIKDSGPGIPDDKLPLIFDPLFTTRQIGTGLGLTSCKTIVEQHSGSINVHTELRKGTTFVIVIPRQQ